MRPQAANAEQGWTKIGLNYNPESYWVPSPNFNKPNWALEHIHSLTTWKNSNLWKVACYNTKSFRLIENQNSTIGTHTLVLRVLSGTTINKSKPGLNPWGPWRSYRMKKHHQERNSLYKSGWKSQMYPYFPSTKSLLIQRNTFKNKVVK